MSKTIIGFIVDNEIAFSVQIGNEDENAEERKAKYLSSPTIVEITHLAYSPANGSVWDGENFVIPENLDISHGESFQNETGHEESRSFAFMVDSVCTGRINLMPLAESAIAALLSSPTFLDITEMVGRLEEGTNYHGMLIRDGEIVSE
jgi:hypothetical protein